MSHARTCSVVTLGVEGYPVDVEAHLSAGLPSMAIVGLPDTAVGEARDRARSAIINSGLPWPSARLTIGLSPAWLPKTGPGLDLAIALAVLAANGSLPPESLAGAVVAGELALDGRVRPVRGSLVVAVTAARLDARTLIVPRANALEAALVPDIAVLGVSTLRGLVARLLGEPPDDDDGDDAPAPHHGSDSEPMPDLSDVRGHREAMEALVHAAAGAHHVAMVGPPGVGKTLLAERFPGLLPDLADDHALEVTAIHSVAGLLDGAPGLVRRPPLSAPHHSATMGAMVGGGTGRSPRVGQVSLAHRGVLFLDEAPEFAPKVLDALRQPMESGVISVTRVGFTAALPASFQLLLAANPCPCGRAGEAATSADCTCAPVQRRRYLSRISGPLLDRVDIRVEVVRPTADELTGDPGPSTALVAQRVHEARARAARRLAGTPWTSNAQIPSSALRQHFAPDPSGADALHALLLDHRVSARGADRVLRLAWTAADLAGRDRPSRREVAVAQRLRTGWEAA